MLKAGEHVYLTWCGAFEKGEAMDYDAFFALYPSLQERKEQLTLLGEDPSLQTDLWPVGEYELNKEITQSDTLVKNAHNVFLL